MKNKETLLLLTNPFVRIAGIKSLLIGLVVFIISILLAYHGHMVFDGVIDAHFSERISLLGACIIPAVSLVIFIILLYIGGRLLSKSSIRFIDVAGTVTLARMPFLLLSLIVLIPGVYESNAVIARSLLTLNYSVPSGFDWAVFLLFLVVSLVCLVWFIVLSYNAFSVSCNVSGAKGIIGFIIILVFSEIVSKIAVYYIAKYGFELIN